MTEITLEQAIAFRQKIERASTFLNDETALDSIEMFPKWLSGHVYNVDDRIQYNELLYKCVQAHTSQDSWTPDVTPALWVRVSIEEYPEWIQPAGAHDAYKLGDKVTYNAKRWISTIDYNTYAPGVYGWNEVT